MQGRERDRKQAHQHVGEGHVDDEDVGGALHALVSQDHEDDQDVAVDPEDEDDEVEEAEGAPDPEISDQELLVADHLEVVVGHGDRGSRRVVAVHGEFNLVNSFTWNNRKIRFN